MRRRGGKIMRHFSAGGVVYRRSVDGIDIAVVGQRSPERWQLPKGTPNRAEAREQAATREAQEETGLVVRLVCPLDEIEYWFAASGQRHFKTVAFYLMEATGGDISLHDDEYEEAAWFPLAEALDRLAFGNEVQIVHIAARILNVTVREQQILTPPITALRVSIRT
jgi:8-oxo-dGTP pyrophosphatase MutT (NUDIX family)